MLRQLQGPATPRAFPLAQPQAEPQNSSQSPVAEGLKQVSKQLQDSRQQHLAALASLQKSGEQQRAVLQRLQESSDKCTEEVQQQRQHLIMQEERAAARACNFRAANSKNPRRYALTFSAPAGESSVTGPVSVRRQGRAVEGVARLREVVLRPRQVLH